MAGPPRFDVVVVGSINRDLTIVAPSHPRPGETVLGTNHYWAGGGKGANQAIAAARMGAGVAMIGAVGDDDSGRGLVADLEAEGIDTTGVRVKEGVGTGLAVITVDAAAENMIVVSPGANRRLIPTDLEASSAVISEASVVLAQLEIPIETVVAASGLASGLFCLNPAPSTRLPHGLLDRVDVLTPNRSELTDLAGDGHQDVESAVASLGGRGSVVVTLGPDGALVVADRVSTRIPSPVVEAVDPTGAGDAFCGALAAGLAGGRDLLESARRAVVAGALAATRLGAQPSMPALGEVETLLAG